MFFEKIRHGVPFNKLTCFLFYWGRIVRLGEDVPKKEHTVPGRSVSTERTALQNVVTNIICATLSQYKR
jgi:hypothetical protein